MRRFLVLCLLLVVPFAADCVLYYADHEAEVTAGSTIEIDVVMVGGSGPAGAETPVACIGMPGSWGSVQSVTYEAYVAGTTLITGSGTFSPPETVDMNASYAFSTGGEMAAWQCYAGANTNYGDGAYGTATFQITTGSAGLYTLQYSVGTVDWGHDYSMTSKVLAVDAASDELDQWSPYSLEPETGMALYKAVYGDGTFVAAGVLSSMGNISLSSGNGKDWAVTALPFNKDITGIAYGNGMFLIINDDGVVTRSTDGSSWMDTAAIGFNARTVAFGGDLFVALGEGELAAVSSDGAIWTTTQATPGSQDLFHGATYGGGTFSAVGYNGTNAIAYASSNGTDWTGTPLTVIDNEFHDVAYGNGRFVAVGGEGLIMWSENGYGSWKLVAPLNDDTLHGISYGNGAFIAVGEEGTILSSIDGITWQKQTSGTGATLVDVTAGEGGFVVVGTTGTILWQGLDSGGGGGGGGCNTSPASNEPLWPELILMVLTWGIFVRWRRKVKG